MVCHSLVRFLRQIFSGQKSELPKGKNPPRNDFWKDPDENCYFGHYGLLGVHQLMVSDFVRTDAFRRSILKSYDKLYDKDVLEIGCGTGILSIFACQAGAKHVDALEPSEAIWYADRVIEENNFFKQICLWQRRIEDTEVLCSPKFDALISEWMGYCLLNEWMLPSVILGRDRFLKKGGLMFPEKAQMYIALTKETDYLKDRAACWKDGWKEMYKIKMDSLGEAEYKSVIGKVGTHVVDRSNIASEPCELLCLDLYTVKLEDIRRKVTADFRLVALEACEVYGFCIWFKTSFPGDIVLDTSPYCESTHWKQTVLYVTPFTVDKDCVISGSITFRQCPDQKRNVETHFNFWYVKDGIKQWGAGLFDKI